jgi:hypothetical protein
MAVRLLFLGELDIHAGSFLPFLSEHGYNIRVINTSHWSFPQKINGTDIPVFNLYENSRIRFLFKGRLEWFRKAILYSLAEKTKFTLAVVKRTLEQERTEIVYGSWGSHSLPELRLVEKFNIPLVYEFLTYPTNILSSAVRIENLFNGSIIKNLNGRILATQSMLNYMSKVFGVSHGRNIVFMECYPSQLFYQRRLPRLSECDGHPHLIFIGSDVYDISPQIEEIARMKIHVHVCRTKKLEQILCRRGLKRFVHEFKKFNHSKLLDGTFATFMTQFDACWVTYSFQKASIIDRFYNSVPNRFSFALTAGIPIVMPRGHLKGCEEIINKHQIGFAYIDYDDLKNKLNKRDLMDYYRNNAVEKSGLFALENNFEKIDRFLKEICNHALE